MFRFTKKNLHHHHSYFHLKLINSMKWLAAAAGSAVSSLLPGCWGGVALSSARYVPSLSTTVSLSFPASFSRSFFILRTRRLCLRHVLPLLSVAAQSCVRSSCRCPLSTTGSISLNRLPLLPGFICLFHPILHTGRLLLRSASSSLFLLRLNPA